MTYVASQIIIWMLLAMAFGFALGWLVNSRRGSSKSKRRGKMRRF